VDQVFPVVSDAILKGNVIFLGLVISLYLYRKRRISYVAVNALMILISMVDIGSFSFPMVQTKNLGPLKERGQLLEYLKGDTDTSRAVVNNRCFIENAGLWYRFQDIQGYDPLILRRYMKYINKSQNIPPDNKIVNMHYVRDFNNHLIDMLNLKYIVDCKSGRILKRESFVPRAYVVHKMVLKNEHEILDYMMGHHFDPLETVVFKSQTKIPMSFPETAIKSPETCRILDYQNDQIVVDVSLKAPGFLILSEVNYPGWQAFVNGKQQTILTGNYMFRTVPLEAGRHTVRFVFNPKSFKVGILVSSISLIVVIITLFIFRNKRELKSDGFTK